MSPGSGGRELRGQTHPMGSDCKTLQLVLGAYNTARVCVWFTLPNASHVAVAIYVKARAASDDR